MGQPVILFSTDPEQMCLLVRQEMDEMELQQIRDKFPKHTIMACCNNHAPRHVVMVTIEAMRNAPDCTVFLTPDDDWIIPDSKL